jgi:hypothetical protein
VSREVLCQPGHGIAFCFVSEQQGFPITKLLTVRLGMRLLTGARRVHDDDLPCFLIAVSVPLGKILNLGTEQ